MHSHDRCGKCGSGDPLRVPATPGEHSHIVTGDRVLHTVAVEKYVCTDCGYVEQWVNSKADLAQLKEALRNARRSEGGGRARR